MGTRHLVCAVVDGDFRIAQYGQFDGYPDGAGLDVLRFVRDADLDAFAERLRATRWLTKEEVKAAWDAVAPGKEWVTLEESRRMERRRPELHRNTGAVILRLVADGEVTALQDERDFGRDGLFCEWGYVVDLDARVLEVYRGFAKVCTRGRWAGQEPKEYDHCDYAPITLIETFPLDTLPTDDEFISTFYERDGEDDA